MEYPANTPNCANPIKGSIQYASEALFSDLNTNMVANKHRMNEPRNATRRLKNEATNVNTSMPTKAPVSCRAVPLAFTVSMTDCGSWLKAVVISSGEKK